MNSNQMIDQINQIVNQSKLKWAPELKNLIKEISDLNPYICEGTTKDLHLMWMEQCCINFPLLYLSSLHLYLYAKKNGCNTFLFATRDCCHWIKIFRKMFPKTQCHYFDCSRNMFKKGGQHFKKYVESLIDGEIKTTIYVDVHGTGQNLFTYFDREFGEIPYCFLLSASCLNYEQLPQICQLPYQMGQLFVLFFSAAGTPIEMLNYDRIGTLQDYTEKGPIRDQLEYPLHLLEPYHVCLSVLIDRCQPLKTRHFIGFKDPLMLQLETVVSQIYPIIQYQVPVIAKYIKHQVKHRGFGQEVDPPIESKIEPIKMKFPRCEKYWHGMV